VCDNAICTPLFEENPRFVACPPPFAVKGALADLKIRNYDNAGCRDALQFCSLAEVLIVNERRALAVMEIQTTLMLLRTVAIINEYLQ
jgi:hypothetical protein